MSRRAAIARALLMALLAAVLYGGWAGIANAGHGAAVALKAAAVQGGSSAFTTLVISSGIEALYLYRKGRPLQRLLASTLPPSASSLVHVAAHTFMGTPEIFRTVLPSVVMGYVFAATYVAGLESRLGSRPRHEGGHEDPIR